MALPMHEDVQTFYDDPVAHMFDRADIVRSAVTGDPIEALCGTWIVVSRAPDGLPVCDECQRLAESAEIRVVR